MKISPNNWLVSLLVSLSLTACGGGGGGGENTPPPGSGGGSGQPVLSVGDAAVEEGDSGNVDLVFTISLSAAATDTVTVDYSTADGSADQTDYQTTNGQATLSAGQTSVDVIVPIVGDLIAEQDEEFTLGLADPVNADLGNSVGVGRINNDDFPFLSVSDASMPEGDAGDGPLSFTVSLDQAGVDEITVDFASSDVTASAGSDYTAATGTLVIPAGDTVATIDVTVMGDTETETDEQLLVNLLNVSANARIADDEGVGVVLNDDLPKVSIEPSLIEEPDSGSRFLTLFTVLNAPTSTDVEVGYAMTPGSAMPGSDYVENTGTITIPAGDVSAPILVEILGDTLIEGSETIELELTSVSAAATLGQVSAFVTIVDNDDPNALPTLTGSGGGVREGDSGTTDLRIQFALNQPLADTISVSYVTEDGSALAPDDYVALAGSVEIPAGETSAVITVAIVGDTVEEIDETLVVNLEVSTSDVTLGTSQVTGRIFDDDNESTDPVRLSITPAEVTEGDIGTASLIFDLLLDKASTNALSVDYVTEAGSATENVDYTRAEGTLTFQPGEVTQAITIEVIGDDFSEDDEFLRLRLSNLTGGAVFDGSSALGTIITDEPLARLSIADVGEPEGDSGIADQVFTVSLSIASQETVSFDFATSDVTATAGDDYVQTIGAVTIPPGDLTATIAVPINGDTVNEDDETYVLNLSNVSVNAVVTDSEAKGTIVNDDGTPGWQTPVSLGTGFQPDVAMDTDGNGAIVFDGPLDPTTFKIPAAVTRILTGALQPQEMFGSYSRSNERPPLAATLGNGELMVTWGGNIGSAYYTPTAGWVEQQISSSGGFYPSLDGNNNGLAIAGWDVSTASSRFTSAWRAAFDSASGWAPEELAENDDTGLAARVKVAIDDAGNRFMFWRQAFSDPAQTGMYFDYYDAATATWLGARHFSELPSTPNYDVTMLGDGKAAVILQMREGLDPPIAQVFFYDPVTGFFDNIGAVGNRSGESELLPEIVADTTGNVFAVWVQNRADGFYDAWVNRYDAALDDWTGPLLLESSDGDVGISGGAIDIAVDDLGNAIAVWPQATVVPNSDFRMRASHYSVADDEWSPPEQIDDDALDEFPKYARIAMDALGNAIVVWEYDNANEIGVAQFIAP